MGARQPFALHAAVLARHQHRECRPAEPRHGVLRLVPASPVGRPRLSPCHHHPDRRCRPARRHGRAPAAAACRNPAVHGGFGVERRCTEPAAPHCRPGGSGARSGGHDGARHGLGRRDRGEGKDRWRHGPAGHHVCDRHRAGAVARRRSDRRSRLAGDLRRQRAARRPGLYSRSSLAARRSPRVCGGAHWLRCSGHAAARPDARRLCTRHDGCARQFRSAQHGAPGCCCRRRRSLRTGRAESNLPP